MYSVLSRVNGLISRQIIVESMNERVSVTR